MKKNLFLVAIVAFVSSCSDNEVCLFRPDEIRISPLLAQVVTSSDDTRTAISGTGTVSWADGDVIGIYSTQASATNVPFTASGSGGSAVWSTTTPIYWVDGVTSHKFLAYYPYASGNSSYSAVKIPALNTQTGVVSASQDFMISNNQNATGVTRSVGAVALIFTHAFALVELKFAIGGGIAARTTLTSFIIAGGESEKLYTLDATSTINLPDGVITTATTTNTITITPASSPTLSATTVSQYALILPGTYAGPTLAVSFKDGGTTSYTTVALPLGTTSFEAAKKYSYTVTISRIAITISNPTITDWTTVTGTPLNPTI